MNWTATVLLPDPMYKSITRNEPETAVGLFILGLESSYVRSYKWREVARLVWSCGTRGRRRRGTHHRTRILGFQLGVHQQLLEIVDALVQFLDIRLQTSLQHSSYRHQRQRPS